MGFIQVKSAHLRPADVDACRIEVFEDACGEGRWQDADPEEQDEALNFSKHVLDFEIVNCAH